MAENGKVSIEQPLTAKRQVLRVNLARDSVEPMTDEVAVEGRMELYINGERYAAFSLYPCEIEELTVGHLLAEGIISRLADIQRIEVSEGRANVYLTKRTSPRSPDTARFVGTDCGGGARKIPPSLWMKVRAVKGGSAVRFTPQVILKSVETLNSSSHIFRKTGGTHASVLLDGNGEVLAFSEDIGRHNAVDKAIGKAAIEGLDFGRILLASTGRPTSEMVIKAANAGIKVLVSISAPTDKGIEVAEMAGLTLVGFARGKRFNLYTHPERVERTYL